MRYVEVAGLVGWQILSTGDAALTAVWWATCCARWSSAGRKLMPPKTDNIDRPTKHSLPLTKYTNLSSDGKWGDLVERKKICMYN